MGKSENYLFFAVTTAIGLKFGRGIQLNEIKWVWKAKVILCLWSMGTQNLKLKLVFLSNCWVIWNQIS